MCAPNEADVRVTCSDKTEYYTGKKTIRIILLEPIDKKFVAKKGTEMDKHCERPSNKLKSDTEKICEYEKSTLLSLFKITEKPGATAKKFDGEKMSEEGPTFAFITTLVEDESRE